MNIINNIFRILNTNEKKNFRKLIILDVVINILDISFLAILLFIVRFYTDPKTICLPAYFPEAMRDKYNLLLIICEEDFLVVNCRILLHILQLPV